MDMSFPRKVSHLAAQRAVPKTSEQYWPVLRNLVELRQIYGLGRPVLSTLRAMITFLERGHVVFASNQKLCDRAEGISQSSLRRHIRSLILAGFARRNDSPNGKRYALRTEGCEDLSFGIDLSPLLARGAELAARLDDHRDSQQRIRHLRKHLGALLYQAEQLDIPADLYDEHRRALRQKRTVSDYETRLESLKSLLKTYQMPEILTATNSQNDCHIDNTNTNISIIEKNHETENLPLTERSLRRAIEDLAPDAAKMLPDAEASDLIPQALKLAEWSGINPLVLSQSQQQSGPSLTALASLLVVQNIYRIKNPTAYFAALVFGQGKQRFINSLSKCMMAG